MIKTFFLSLAVLSLAACTTSSGPTPILSEKGPTAKDPSGGLIKQFKDSADAAMANPGDSALAHSMADNGFSLIYANCSDFFLSAGETQKWLIVARDTVGALGTVASGVIALHDKNATKAGAIALGTSTAFASLDIYTKNFLFAAENVSAVRTLTSKALIAHKEAVLSSGQLSYNSASLALFDNQQICSPMSIAALAREAIQKGDVVASQGPSVSLGQIQDSQDEKVLRSLGLLLNPPGSLSMDQAGALWWLLMEPSTDVEKKNYIAPKLKELPAKANPFDSNGILVAGYSGDKVYDILKLFSPGTKMAIKAAIGKTKEALHKRNVELAEAAAAIAKAQAEGKPISNNAPSASPLPDGPNFGRAQLAREPSTHFSIGIK